MSKSKFILSLLHLILGGIFVLIAPNNALLPGSVMIGTSCYWTLRLAGEMEDIDNG